MKKNEKRFMNFIEEYKKVQELFDRKNIDITYSTHTYNTYLSDNKENEIIINNVLDNKKVNLISAPTGSGKTATLVKLLSKKEGIKILTVPSRSLALQVAEKYSKYNIIPVVGGMQVFDDYDNEENNFFVCTYDMLKYLEDYFLFDKLKKYEMYIIVDECHNLCSYLTFKADVINEVENILNKTIINNRGTVIYLTASYEVMKYLNFDNAINFCQEEDYKANTKEFILYENSKEPYNFNSFLYNIIKDSKNFIRHNSFKSTDILYDYLTITDNKKVLTANGNDKISFLDEEGNTRYKNELVDGIINNEKIPNCDQCFVSSAYEAGLNINNIDIENKEEMNSIYCIKEDFNLNFMSIEQFFNRIRFKNNKYIIALNSNKSNKSNKNNNIKSLIDIIKYKINLVNKNIKYFDGIISLLLEKYSIDEEMKLRNELNYYLSFESADGTINDLGCIYLDKDLKLLYSKKDLFYQSYLEYMEQFFYNRDALVLKLEEIFNINIKVISEDYKVIDFVNTTDKVCDILREIKEDKELMKKIEHRIYDDNKILSILKNEKFKEVEELIDFGLGAKDSIEKVINEKEEDLKNIKKELLNKTIINLDKNTLRTLRLIILKDRKISSFKLVEEDIKNIRSILNCKYIKYIYKALEQNISIKEILNIILKSDKEVEICNYFIEKQYITNNNLFLLNRKALPGKAGKEQEIILEYLLTKNNKINSNKKILTDEILDKIIELLENEINNKNYKYSRIKVRNIICKMFDTEDVITKENSRKKIVKSLKSLKK